MDIEKLMLPIAEFTEYGEVCFAHLSENGERKETLREHTELCQKYWKEIVKRKKIDEIFQEFENVYLEELSKESRNLFELMTVNIVSVHDLGKINPNFQSDKMHHKWHEEVKPDPNIGSRHSILSSVFYLDYFLGKINEMWEAKQLIKKSEAEILKDFAYIYSYIISRHHGELKEFETYMASLTGKQMEGENLGKRAKSWYMMWKENILHESERKVKLHNVRSKMNAFIYQFSCKAEFMEDEQIGELYYIENGEAYFDENDILRRELFEEGKDLFI